LRKRLLAFIQGCLGKRNVPVETAWLNFVSIKGVDEGGERSGWSIYPKSRRPEASGGRSEESFGGSEKSSNLEKSRGKKKNLREGGNHRRRKTLEDRTSQRKTKVSRS